MTVMMVVMMIVSLETVFRDGAKFRGAKFFAPPLMLRKVRAVRSWGLGWLRLPEVKHGGVLHNR